MKRGTRGSDALTDTALPEAGDAAAADKTSGDTGRVDDDAPAAAVASLEPALWKRLTDAEGPAEAARAWLALQCSMIDDVTRGVVLLAGRDTNSFEAAGVWPEGSGKPTALAQAAEMALRQRRGFASEDRSQGSEPAGVLHVAVPILLDDELEGAVAVTVRSGRTEDGRLALRQLQWGVAWIRERLRQARAEAQGRLLDRSRTALDLIGGALDHERFDAAAFATVTGLALRANCSRVSLGFRDGKFTKVKVISHTAQFGQEMNLIRCLGAAMDEALDQHCVVLYPGNPDQLLATSAHNELSRVQHDGQILTVPLLVGERFVGAITFERSAGSEFEPDMVELLEHVTSVIGPVLEAKRQNDRWLPVKIVDSLRLQLTRLFGPGHLIRKLIVAAVVVVAIFLTFARSDYQIGADAKIEGLVQRAVVAPYDGFIKSVSVRAGDTVAKGQVMATLEDRDFLLQRLKWVTELQQHRFEYDKALATGQPATINVVRAQMEQDNAQIKLLDEELARTKLRSSIAGLVVSGDLSQMIGAAVQRGQLLFQVAPLDKYRIILNVDERDIDRIKPGQTGDLIVTALPNKTLHFKVSKITPIAHVESGHNVFRVEGLLDLSKGRPANLRPGMEGVGKIEIGRRSLAWIWLHPMIDWAQVWSWRWLP